MDSTRDRWQILGRTRMATGRWRMSKALKASIWELESAASNGGGTSGGTGRNFPVMIRSYLFARRACGNVSAGNEKGSCSRTAHASRSAAPAIGRPRVARWRRRRRYAQMRTGADRVSVRGQWTRARGLHRTVRVARITRDGSTPESRWIASEARLTSGDAMRGSGAHRASSTPVSHVIEGGTCINCAAAAAAARSGVMPPILYPKLSPTFYVNIQL
ncbi:hypothetical protein C8R45DRAFT_1076177 [Mycena sanguinolenta]|nr:hypothetical protein C8R45DRAFT_1076177 [Mycena sanguinolenta]